MIEVGDRVRVLIPEDSDVPDQMYDFNKKEFMVIRTFKGKSSSTGYCTLDGAESEFGCNYFFMNEWLQKL